MERMSGRDEGNRHVWLKRSGVLSLRVKIVEGVLILERDLRNSLRRLIIGHLVSVLEVLHQGLSLGKGFLALHLTQDVHV